MEIAWFRLAGSSLRMMPPVYVCSGMALSEQAMGPRAKISRCIVSSPLSRPYSATVALGKTLMAEQKPPLSAKVLHVRQVLSAEQE
jgi:hypothetical protein